MRLLGERDVERYENFFFANSWKLKEKVSRQINTLVHDKLWTELRIHLHGTLLIPIDDKTQKDVQSDSATD
jgi:hypothetical protein